MQRSALGALLGLAGLLLLGGCHGQQASTETAPGPPGPAASSATPSAPAGGAATNTRNVLNAKVKNALLANRVDISKVAVEIGDDGVVTLKGSVPQADQKAEAAKRVKEVPGVAEVHDELTVAP